MSEKEEKGNQTATTPNDTINTAINRPSKISSFFAFSEKLASSEYLRWLMIALLPVLILLEYKVDGSDMIYGGKWRWVNITSLITP